VFVGLIGVAKASGRCTLQTIFLKFSVNTDQIVLTQSGGWIVRQMVAGLTDPASKLAPTTIYNEVT